MFVMVFPLILLPLTKYWKMLDMRFIYNLVSLLYSKLFSLSSILLPPSKKSSLLQPKNSGSMLSSSNLVYMSLFLRHNASLLLELYLLQIPSLISLASLLLMNNPLAKRLKLSKNGRQERIKAWKKANDQHKSIINHIPIT